MMLNSHDCGLMLYAGDTEPDSFKKMINLYTLCNGLTFPKPAYTVSVVGVADGMVSDCHRALEDTGLANLDNARRSHTIVRRKPDKCVPKHAGAFAEDTDFWVVGYKSENKRHPGTQIPGKWPLKSNLDTKVLDIPSLRHRLINPSTGKAENLAENNGYCAYSVSFICLFVNLYIYFVLACSFAMRFSNLVTGFFFRLVEQEVFRYKYQIMIYMFHLQTLSIMHF